MKSQVAYNAINILVLVIMLRNVLNRKIKEKVMQVTWDNYDNLIFQDRAIN